MRQLNKFTDEVPDTKEGLIEYIRLMEREIKKRRELDRMEKCLELAEEKLKKCPKPV